MAFDLAGFHRRNKSHVVREWVSKLHSEAGAQYSGRPVEELRKTVTRAYDANHKAVVEGDYSRLNRFIKKITSLRLEALVKANGEVLLLEDTLDIISGKPSARVRENSYCALYTMEKEHIQAALEKLS